MIAHIKKEFDHFFLLKINKEKKTPLDLLDGLYL
jgi:hypothetical protein